MEGVEAVVVETEPVDQGLRLRQAEHARLGVARLCLGCHGADLDEAETHGAKRIDAAGILVQASGEPDPVGETQSGQLHRIVDHAGAISPCQRRAMGAGQCLEREFVGGLGVQAEQEGTGQGVGNQRHWIIQS